MLAHQLAAVHQAVMDHLAFSPSRHDIAGQAKRFNAVAEELSINVTIRWVVVPYHNWISSKFGPSTIIATENLWTTNLEPALTNISDNWTGLAAG